MSQTQPASAEPRDPQRSPEQQRHLRRVLLSSYLGSTVEYYDFLVYGTAASLVFGRLFFTDQSPLVGTIAAFGTLAAGYLARPVGGMIFGHFGDRVGRKQMLIITMMLMGVSSTLIGLLPTQQQIGVAAPVLLVVLRLVQGVALGGECGGATLMALEHSPSRRRGWSVGIVNAGGPSGAVLAALVMGAFSLLPEGQFLSWGWRVPFLISAVLVGVALWIRIGVYESPIFRSAVHRQTPEDQRFPLVEVLRRPGAVVLSAASGIAPTAVQSLLATFALTFAVLHGTGRSTALFAAALASVVNVVMVPLFGALSDRVGRRPVLLGGLLAGAALVHPALSMIGSGDTAQVFGGYVIGYGLIVAALMGTLSSFISEQFSTTSRYTGSSLGYQLAATLGAGFAPLVAAHLLAGPGDGADVWPVSVFVVVLCVVSAVAVLCTRELSRADISH